MDNLNNIAFEAVNNYFTALSKLGYLSNAKVNQLWLLLFLQEFLENYEWIITEADYNTIDKIITCLQGSSCLVPYSKDKLITEPIRNYLLNIPVRETEDDVIRTTEGINLRLPNQL